MFDIFRNRELVGVLVGFWVMAVTPPLSAQEARTQTQAADPSTVSDKPAVSLGAQDPWKSLDNFTPLPSSLTRIAERYVAMILVNRDEQLMAAVFFDATCFEDSCELHHRAGYAVVNAEGSYRRLYVDPQEEELKELLTSISARYSRES